MPKYGPGRRESCWILVSFDDPAVAKTNAEMKPVPKRNAKKEGETEKPPPLGVVFCREKGNPWLFAQENGAMCLAESIVGNWKAEKVQVFGRQWNGKEAEVMHTFQKRIWIEGRGYQMKTLFRRIPEEEDEMRGANTVINVLGPFPWKKKLYNKNGKLKKNPAGRSTSGAGKKGGATIVRKASRFKTR